MRRPQPPTRTNSPNGCEHHSAGSSPNDAPLPTSWRLRLPSWPHSAHAPPRSYLRGQREQDTELAADLIEHAYLSGSTDD